MLISFPGVLSRLYFPRFGLGGSRISPERIAEGISVTTCSAYLWLPIVSAAAPTPRNRGRISQGLAVNVSRKRIQKLVDEKPYLLNSLIRTQLNLPDTDTITWLSPVAEDG